MTDDLYMEFKGWDRLELYLDDEGFLTFCQEFGGHNTMSVEDVIKLRSICDKYLKMRGIE